MAHLIDWVNSVPKKVPCSASKMPYICHIFLPALTLRVSCFLFMSWFVGPKVTPRFPPSGLPSFPASSRCKVYRFSHSPFPVASQHQSVVLPVGSRESVHANLEYHLCFAWFPIWDRIPPLHQNFMRKWWIDIVSSWLNMVFFLSREVLQCMLL